jgi:transcriptional regulator with XRE-family HTH domain
MHQAAEILRRARRQAGLSQQEIAVRAGTSQPAVARLEGGHGTVTVATLERLVGAAGFDLDLMIVPRRAQDPVTAAYRRDVDRTLLRENLRRSVDDRLRTGAEMVDATRELERATKAARRRRGP